MSIFEYLIATIMLVLGLGVTQLLSDVVDAFRRRQTYRLHWIPMTWAGIIFAWQMQFLWAVFELQSIKQSWTAFHFIVMLMLGLLLFVAGSLVVPNASDETDDALTQFQQDGRLSLLVLAVFFGLAYFANVILFKLSYWAIENLEDLLLALILLFTVFTKKEKIWAIATVAFVLLSILAIIDLSPTMYE